jgi:RNA polymerase sigma factor (sigma-70 family)
VNERRLLEAARGGDENAFARLVEPHRGALHVHCYRMLGSVHDADDALQEALLGAWKGRSGFEGRSSLRSWLYTIATNASLRTLAGRSSAVLRRREQIGHPVHTPAPVRLELVEDLPRPGHGVWVGAHEPLPSSALLGDQTGAIQQRDMLLHRGEAHRVDVGSGRPPRSVPRGG